MKTTLFILLAVLISIVIPSCNKYSSGPGSQHTLTLGSSYGGGIIAYILQPGDPGYNASVQHGLIAAPSDQSTGIQWGCYGTTVGDTATTIGTGQANTDSIVSHCGTGTAAYICHTLTLGGYTDWYLPSEDELLELYINQIAIGGFASAFYWSSSENNSYSAFDERFGNGTQWATQAKEIAFYVRAVRSF